jgi:predicted metal-dependent phosphoesterase TrpH
MIFDLHSHTTFSDGALTPGELLERADELNIDVLSITDHDTIDAYDAALPVDSSVSLVAGIEFSTQWMNSGIHVLGLNVDTGSPALAAGVRFQTDARRERARRISDRLARKGIENAYEAALEISEGQYIGRPHFAQHLINIGKARSMNAAFKTYMGDGKAGDVKQHWAELAQIIDWIRDANGIPVLAHPLKYKLTRSKLKRLLDQFLRLGGLGMEVVSGRQLPYQTADLADLCVQKNILASCGSDFHGPGRPWAELGSFSPLPRNVTPVWDKF